MDMEKAPSFQEFLKLLEENNRSDQGQDLSLMAWYLDGMERQYNAVLQELHDVKTELAQVPDQQVPSKSIFSSMLETLETKVEQARERLAAFRDKIMECVKDATDRFKDAGVSVLDNTVAAMRTKQGLQHLQEGMQSSLSAVKDALWKAEDMGAELRQAGQYVKNVGRIAASQEPRYEPSIDEGRFQSVILAPMRGVQKMLSNINNNTLAAISVVEDLELSADAARDRQAERAAKKPGKRLGLV